VSFGVFDLVNRYKKGVLDYMALVVVTDASPLGLGAILSQYDDSDNRKIIAYASKTLSPIEQRYSQTEREALAIVWSCEHFNFYLFGQKFKLVTDHKPLELIFGKPDSKTPVRIEGGPYAYSHTILQWNTNQENEIQATTCHATRFKRIEPRIQERQRSLRNMSIS
jgi:hypothetical protein